MAKRILLALTAVLVLAFLAYVGVSAANGNYGEAAGIGAQDAAAANEGYAVVGKIREVPWVTSATFAFTPGLVAERKSMFTVKMTATASLTDIGRVADLVRNEYDHSPGTAAGAVLAIVLPGAPALSLASFWVSRAQLASELTIWGSIPQSTGTSISVGFGNRGQRTLAIVSTRRASFAWMAKHYALLKALAADGFTWTNPGGCILNDLPDPAALAVMTKLSAIVPVACNSSKQESVLLMETGVPPSALLSFVAGSKTEPFSAHASQFARVAAVLLSRTVPRMNVGFSGMVNGKPTDLVFFTGTCSTNIVASPYKQDAASLSILKSYGVDIADRATLGICLEAPFTPTATSTPAG
jgi:hypothetical protein